MNALNDSIHEEIAEMLPDFTIGALNDGDLWRVEAHLESCTRCQQELALLIEVVSVVTPVAAPSFATKASLFERAGYPLPEKARPIHPTTASQPLRATGANAQPSTSRLVTFPSRISRLLLPVAAVMVLALGGWNILLQREVNDQSDLATLLADPGVAFPLTDSEVQTSASATIFVDPSRDKGLLTAERLPQLTSGGRYHVWLFTEDGQRVSGGTFIPDTSGSVITVVKAPASFDMYWAVAISAEPEGLTGAPSNPLLLGGWIHRMPRSPTS